MPNLSIPGRAPLQDWPQSDQNGGIKGTWQHWYNAVTTYLSDIVPTIQATQATFPDTSALPPNTIIFIVDFDRMMFWDGSLMHYMGDDPGSVTGFIVAPSEGYTLCNGSNTTYLKLDGTTGAITLPNLVGSPAFPAPLQPYFRR